MTTTTTRGRPGRPGAARPMPAPAPRPRVHPQRDGHRSDYSAHVDGANALQVGYSEPIVPRTREATPRRSAEAGPAGASRREQVSTVGNSPAAMPQLAPLPVALPRAPFLVLVVSIVVVGVLGVLLLNTKINENAFRLDSLRQQQAALDQQEQALERELAQRESPGELRAAAARLGLVPAGTPAFISLPDGRVVGVPQPAGSTGSGR